MSRNTLLLGAAENGGYFNNVREGGKVNARLCSIFIGEKKNHSDESIIFWKRKLISSVLSFFYLFRGPGLTKGE